MYREYFGLRENPFSIAPDPRYLFLTQGHREALAHLLYGITTDGGLVLLTGEIGAGKTTICRSVIEHLPANTEIAFILNPRLSADELLATVCDEFGIGYPQGTTSVKVLVSAIYKFLLDVHAKDKRAILIIEEAQNLSADVLEQVRLLTNLETNERKLLQVIMVGQPELRDLLARPELKQLSQRITARYHLGGLSKQELPAYIRHRLSVGGLVRDRLFPRSVVGPLFRMTGGVPRLVNVICDRALTGAFVQGKERVDRHTLKTAAREVYGGGTRLPRRKLYYGALLLGGLILLLGVLGTASLYKHPIETPAFGRFWRAEPASRTRTPEPVTRPGINGLEAAILEKAGGTNPSGTREAAMQALFSAWKIRYDPKDGRNPCEQARDSGLECLTETGDLPKLRRMNKPAVLTLKDKDKPPYYAALTSVTRGTATLSVGGEDRRVNIAEKGHEWSGDYLVLCRPPWGYRGEIRRGSRGALVAWLDRQLALALGGGARPLGTTVFDGRLEERVKKFQRGAGLEDNGVVGLSTIIFMTGEGEDSGPRLEDSVGST